MRDAGALAIDDDEPSPTSRQGKHISYVYSSAWPTSPPSAQPRRAPRPIQESSGVVMGRAFAAENADLYSVMADLETHILPRTPMWWTPREGSSTVENNSLKISLWVRYNPPHEKFWSQL